jgi:TolB-like protein
VKPGWRLRAHRFRGPVRGAAVLLSVVLIAGAGAWWFRPTDIAAAKPTIAVLPFDNLSGDDATSRLADGITEDIITDLARFPEFDVIARNSTETYKDKAVDVRQVGKDLGAGFVLEGSLQRQGDQMRVTAQLIESQDGRHVWSERWDRPSADVFAVQTEIAEQVANRMGGGAGLIQTAGREAARRKRPENLNAYELYLLGTEKLEQFTKVDIEESIRLLTRAVELDPGLARAWIELSHAHSLAPTFGGDRTAAQKLAMEAAARAVALDLRDAEAHAALAMRLGEAGEFVRAKSAFDTAIALSPGSAEILTFYASWASTFGEPERGAELVDRAIRLNPEYPMWASGPFSWAYFMAGRYADAARLLERVPPEAFNPFRWVILAGSYAAQGMAGEAETTRKKALASFPDLTIEGFISDPGMNDTERQKFADKMRLAGFPSCATPEQMKGLENPFRLPECSAMSTP